MTKSPVARSIQYRPLVRSLKYSMIGLLMMAHFVLGNEIVLGPYVQNVTPESIVIIWKTDLSVASHITFQASAQDERYLDNPKPVTHHEAKLVDLKPDTVYTYDVISDTNDVVFESTFRTAPNTPRSFRFVVYGDNRSRPDSHEVVINAIVRSHPEIVLHTGDLVGAGEIYESWSLEFFEPAYGLMHNTPMFPILGNHEYFYSGRSWFSSFFALPNNEQWFAFTYGNVRFIGLDTNVSFFPESEQYRWFEAELKSDACRQATWRIVYFHHPPFTVSRYRDDPEVVQYLVPLFETGEVDLVFSGHSHAYERYFLRGIHYIVTGGGGAPLVPLPNDTEPPLRVVGKSVLHHCVVDINVPDSSLTLSVLENDGTAFDGLTLTKPLPDPNLADDLTGDPNLVNLM